MKTKFKHPLMDMLAPVMGRLSTIVACLLLIGSVRVTEAYQNPVLYVGADPDVSRLNGSYHMIVGQGNHYVYRNSKDLINWSAPVNILTQPNGYSLWEGYMTYNSANGDYWLYYTLVDPSGNPSIHVAKSTNGPTGPYATDAGFSFDTAIDPYFFEDSLGDGSKYLYYKDERVGHKEIRVQKLTWYNNKVGQPNYLLLSPNCSAGSGDPGWECCGGYASLEGPCVKRFGSKYFLIYVGGAFGQPCYSIGFAWSTSPVGPFTRRSSGDPIMSNWESSNCYSIGAPNVVADADNNNWIVYRQWPNPPSGSHHFCIEPLTTDPANNSINAQATTGVTITNPVPLP